MAALLLATTAWGGMFPIAGSAVRILDPASITLLRYTSVALLLGLVLVWREGPRMLFPEGEVLRLLFFGTVGMMGFNVLALYGLRIASPALASMIMVTLPFLVAALHWFTKGQAPPRITMICAGLALLGVALVISRGRGAASLFAAAERGELLVLLGACCWAVYTVGRECYPDWSALRFSALSCGFGSLGLAVFWLLSIAGGFILPPSGSSIVAVGAELAYLISLAGVIAILAWVEGIRRLGATHAALFMSMVPITAFTIEMARGFRPHWPELLGTGLAIAALALNSGIHQPQASDARSAPLSSASS